MSPFKLNLCNYHANNIRRYSEAYSLFVDKKNLHLVVMACKSIAVHMTKAVSIE